MDRSSLLGEKLIGTQHLRDLDELIVVVMTVEEAGRNNDLRGIPRQREMGKLTVLCGKSFIRARNDNQ